MKACCGTKVTKLYFESIFPFSPPSNLSNAFPARPVEQISAQVDYENYLLIFHSSFATVPRSNAPSARVSGSAHCVCQISCRCICAVTSHRNHFIILSSVEKRVSGPIMLANPRLGTFSQLTMHNFSIYRVFLLFLFRFFFSNPPVPNFF